MKSGPFIPSVSLPINRAACTFYQRQRMYRPFPCSRPETRKSSLTRRSILIVYQAGVYTPDQGAYTEQDPPIRSTPTKNLIFTSNLDDGRGLERKWNTLLFFPLTHYDVI